MKINRNYRFVLTVLDNEKINAGEWPRENGISGSTPLAGANIKFTVI